MAGSGESDRAVAGSGKSEQAVAGSGESERAMAVSGVVGERAAAGSGEEGERVAAGSGEGGQRAVSGSGEGGKRTLLHSLDYPCTTRFRLRRLLACIRDHGHVDVQLAAQKNMYVIFHLKYLVNKLRQGHWRDASYYLGGFIGYDSSYETRLLVTFLQDLVAFKAFADGQIRVIGYLCDWLISIYGKQVLDKYPCFATVVTDVLFMRKDHASDFLDWELVAKKAAKMVKEIAYKAPDLKGRMQYPCCGNSLSHVVPIGSRRCVKHVNRKQQSADLVQFYLQMKKRLPTKSLEADHSKSESAMVRGEQLIALFDKCFEAGRLLGLEHAKFPKVSSKQGFPYLLARGFKVSNKQAKLSSKPDTAQRSAVVGSSVTYVGIKRSRCFLESQQDTMHPGNDPKKLRNVGNFGDDPSSSFKGIPFGLQKQKNCINQKHWSFLAKLHEAARGTGMM